jgi:hypothetical protein
MFYGREKKQGFDEYHPYDYCDCNDYKLNEKINNQIEELERRRPKKKFKISNRNFLEEL